jgi:hypothetical protein
MMPEKCRSGYFWGAVAASLGCALLILIVCAMPADQNGNGNYSITLTLDDNTSTEATFSGKPIQAFLTFRDSVFFDDVAWHLGAGSFEYPAITPGKKIKKIQVSLF